MTAYTLRTTAIESHTTPARPAPASSNIRPRAAGSRIHRLNCRRNRSHHIGSLSQRTIATALTAESASQSTVNWPSESSALGARRTVVAATRRS